MPAARKPSRKSTSNGSPSSTTSPLPTEQWTEPPFCGFIETTEDALLILEAARRRLIPRVTRRLSDRERKLIASGSVFVFEEEESGIKRWTDSLVWSPSRILGNFLIYRETDKRNPDGSQPTRPGHRNSQSSGGGPSSILVAETDTSIPQPSSSAAAWSGSLSRPKGTKTDTSLSGEAGSSGLDRARERVLLGSLTNSTKFKDDGMMKKTFSLTLPGTNKTHHLVSYYKVSDVEAGRLRTPSSLPELAALDISPDFLERTHFRVPPRVELGEDGRVRYRGEPQDDQEPESPPAHHQSFDSVPPSSSGTAVSPSRSPSYGHSSGSYRQPPVDYSALTSAAQAQSYLNNPMSLDVGLGEPTYYPPQPFSPSSTSYSGYMNTTSPTGYEPPSTSSSIYGYPSAIGASYTGSSYDDGGFSSSVSVSRANSMTASGDDLTMMDPVMGGATTAGPIAMTHQSLAHSHGHTSASVASTVASSASDGSGNTLVSSSGSGSTSPGISESRRSSMSAVCSPMIVNGVKSEPNDVDGLDVGMGMMMEGVTTTLSKGWQNGTYVNYNNGGSGYDNSSMASSASANSYSIPPPQVIRQHSHGHHHHHHQQQQQQQPYPQHHRHHSQMAVKTSVPAAPTYTSSMVSSPMMTSPTNPLAPAIPAPQNYYSPSQSHPVYSNYHSQAPYFNSPANSGSNVPQPYTEHAAMSNSGNTGMYSPDTGSAASHSSGSNGGSVLGSPMSSEGGYGQHHVRTGSLGGSGRNTMMMQTFIS
ncbi:hypothetical protein FRC03_004189 [Tulasnella sp. 419]|nr:hypothetical protein FRC03_004189 [Tulasnella sp. 419]